MATDTAPLPTTQSGVFGGPATAGGRTTSSSTDPTRHLWQLPVLLIGIAVFVSAWKGWLPIGRNDPPSVFTRDIDALKASYEKLSPDPIDLKSQLSKVAAGVEMFPEHAPRGRFHLGSGYVRLAEITASADEARGYWTLAQQHFALVTPEQLRDSADRPKLDFRSAKVRAAIGLPAEAPNADLVALLIQVLSAPPPGEEGGETRRLIAELALRRNPQDLALARTSLTQYLHSAGTSTPQAALSRARLRLGAIYLELHEYDQARKWLAQVGGDSPAEVLAPAKAGLARALMADGDFLGAAKELEVLRTIPGIPVYYRTGAAYDLALCKIRANDRDAATKYFEEAARGTGAEATAAAVQLADLHLHSPDPSRHKLAVDLLTDAVRGVKSAAEYKSELVPVTEVQAAFELGVTTLLADGAFEQALKVAETYAAVAPSPRDRERRADVLATWGAALKKTNGNAKPKLKDAADEFAALAEFQPRTDGKLEMLRRAATLYRQAEEPALAVTRLKEAAKLPGISESALGPLLSDLADAMLESKQTGEVWKVFREILATNGATSTATRYRLARQFVDSRHPGLVPVGRALFEQIAKQQNIAPNEREYHERALTELANDLIQQENFADAEARLRTQLKLYDNGPESQLAKLLLGVCLLQRAAALSRQNPLSPQEAQNARDMRTEALTKFKEIVMDCDKAAQKPDRNGKLTDREAWLRLQASLRVLQSYQQMQDNVQARNLLNEGAALRDRHKGTVEELIILSLMYKAYEKLEKPSELVRVREEMKDVFSKLPQTAFTHGKGEYSREYWLKVWFSTEQ
ncbi:hypothetical protein VT84_00875 [Gemmata sp. SH-PL17]|uniref:tetratricopeptide repeat protein n=1 Tax=Gemmata sp. SH-PL17 TaxID=1630693 RepID=UPI0004B65CF4|nr:hypothetical protein [Gemmata sp. SH-PL17]AMV22931.1 hypothetical protein VT84_00875 [Gemmata sp. SH-PL17]